MLEMLCRNQGLSKLTEQGPKSRGANTVRVEAYLHMAETFTGLKHQVFAKVSYQGIALAMPKVLRYESAFRRCGQRSEFTTGS
jgi:hypothetical protein